MSKKEVLKRLGAVAESRFISVAEVISAYQAEVAHRELRQAVADPAEVKEQQVTDLVGAKLDEDPARIETSDKLVGIDVLAGESDELGFL